MYIIDSIGPVSCIERCPHFRGTNVPFGTGESVLFMEVSSIQVCPYIVQVPYMYILYTVHVCILHVTIEAALYYV